jgi:hypothetical protein
MNSEDVDEFRKMLAQLSALHQEMVAASKKAPDKPVSKFKVTLANEVLELAKNVLGDSAPALKFDKFDSDDLPSVSDVNFVVSQYVECAEKIRCENITRNHNNVWYWVMDGKMSDIATSVPRGG